MNMGLSTVVRKLTTSLVMACFCFISSAQATSYAKPKDRDIKSSNGQYLLHINAGSGLHEVKEGEKVLWSFEKNVWHNDYYVSDDGKYVLWVAWKYVKEEDLQAEAVVVYSSEGVVLKKTYAEVGTPRKYKEDEIGPIGDFWRIWRAGVIIKERVISIEVAGNEKPLEIEFSKLGDLGKKDAE